MTILTMPCASGRPLQTGDLYLRPLTADDLGQIVCLHEAVTQSLPETQKAFLVHKGPDAFQAMVGAPNHGVGIFTRDKELIAQAFIKVSHEGGDLAGLTDCPSARFLAAQCGAFAVPQSVAVHPHHRGRHLMGLMLDTLEELAKDNKISWLVTEVAEGNDRSAAGFMHHDYGAANHGVDPSDGTKLIFLAKNLRPVAAMKVAGC